MDSFNPHSYPISQEFSRFFLFFFFILFIYLFLAVLGLPCYLDFSLVVAGRGYSLVAHGLLIAMSSLVAEHGL